MDLNTITEYRRETNAEAVQNWQSGYSWLAGGTWLFSEPQPEIHTLIDIESFAWPSLTVSSKGLEIGATCKIAELEAFIAPPEWKAAPLFRECCRSLLASFKIWNEATVGGNVCMALPAGAMISLTAALEGICTLWPRDGAPREVSVMDFVTDNHANVLRPGELLRSIFLPESALRKTYAFRRFSLTKEGRSSVLLIGTRCPESGSIIITVTAATKRPVQLKFTTHPTAETLKQALDTTIPFDLYFDDFHGTPPHRRHLTCHFAEEIRQKLSGFAP